jgi:hypothetical protein
MSETRIFITLLRMYFLRNWEFGSALSKLRNFGGVNTPPRYATATEMPCDTECSTFTVFFTVFRTNCCCHVLIVSGKAGVGADVEPKSTNAGSVRVT